MVASTCTVETAVDAVGAAIADHEIDRSISEVLGSGSGCYKSPNAARFDNRASGALAVIVKTPLALAMLAALIAPLGSDGQNFVRAIGPIVERERGRSQIRIIAVADRSD